jgi:hypothetical protein
MEMKIVAKQWCLFYGFGFGYKRDTFKKINGETFIYNTIILGCFQRVWVNKVQK